MANTRVNIYSEKGTLVGYFLEPQIDAFGQGEYEIRGQFHDLSARLTTKLEFNPQSAPYIADLSMVENLPHRRLKQVYIQSGRQPVKMTGVGEI
jgi:hypothetical protein